MIFLFTLGISFSAYYVFTNCNFKNNYFSKTHEPKREKSYDTPEVHPNNIK